MDVKVQCCIAGGGPAGLMLGVLLSRAGVKTIVLEKHSDFLRDFRGDTIHPSTLQLMDELGWLGEFLELPHTPVPRIEMQVGYTRLLMADFSTLPVAAKFIAMMPQWDFLNFLAAKGSAYPGFDLKMDARAQWLVEENGRVVGLEATTRNGPLNIRADLVVAADGRDSDIRRSAGFEPKSLGAPMDVLWFGLPRKDSDPSEVIGRFAPGGIFVMLNRGVYWQCAYVIPKGHNDRVRAAGLEAFRKSVGKLLPVESDRANAIASFDDVKLLTVQVNRLEKWCKPGFLAIGDAAHAMSPVGGVGINLAVQDAVATANALATPLRDGRLTLEDLQRVEKRRMWPTVATQKLQVIMQNSMIAPTLAAKGEIEPPFMLKVLSRFPYLARIPARLIGMGVRPEHISPEIRFAEG